jgi:hypothetical protein
MSTKERAGRRGSAAGIVIALLCLAGLACLGVYIYRQQLPPPAPETAVGYAAAPEASVPVYDGEGAVLGSLTRGTEVHYVLADMDSDGAYVRVVNGETYVLLEKQHLALRYEDAVQVDTVYALRGMSLLDETGAVPGCAVEKGMALTVTGFDGLDDDGAVLRWRVSCDRGEGYIAADNVRMTEKEALAQYDETLYQLHASRGDSWGGGDAAGLDYYPVEKGPIPGNDMPDEVRALYLNGSAVQYADSYVQAAEGSGVNAFVVDIVDGTAVSYASPVMQQYSPSAYAAAMDTMEGFRANVQKLKDAGYYLIGRITVFNDAHLAADHPEQVICDLNGTPLQISHMYWPSAYDRTVWRYKVDLALEAAALGFNEIQFDYIRFPDGAYSYEKAGTIDYRNTYGESKAQAVQRFLLYAAERLHSAGYYLSGDVFGECANPYVTACGQYWPAISAAVDAISGMPYPDHYSAQGDYKPWEHPYDTVHMFGAAAAQRQAETASPAAVRTWIQAYNALWEPYNTYGEAEVAAEVKALRDTGCTGGFMTWNGGSDINKYRSIIGALR